MNALRPAVIAVASGKGGTGKTTMAVHLALASARTRATLLVDLDVEAPDVLGYFPMVEPLETPSSVSVAVPRLVGAFCTGCGLCANSCRFGAIIAIGGVVTIDEKVCKGCGRCVAVCPAGALVEGRVEVGAMVESRVGALSLLEGRMAVGDIRSTAVIDAAKRRAAELGGAAHIRDCPPGISCPATHAMEGADFVILVAEPTRFSAHDLFGAMRYVRDRGLAAGILINKYGFGSVDIEELADREGLPVVGRVAFERDRAGAGAAGRLWESNGDFMRQMEDLVTTLIDMGNSSRGGFR